MELTMEERIAGASAAKRWAPGMAIVWLRLGGIHISEGCDAAEDLKKHPDHVQYG